LTLSSELGECTKLTILDLVSNNLQGPLPEEIGALTSLDYFGMDDNFNETIP
jgi:Leucine-rich repeat (LRR) protein